MGNDLCRKCQHQRHYNQCGQQLLNPTPPETCPCVSRQLHPPHAHGSKCESLVTKARIIRDPIQVEEDVPVYRTEKKKENVTKLKKVPYEVRETYIQTTYTKVAETVTKMVLIYNPITKTFLPQPTITTTYRSVPQRHTKTRMVTKYREESYVVVEDVEKKVVDHYEKQMVTRYKQRTESYDANCDCEFSCSGSCCKPTIQCKCLRKSSRKIVPCI